MEAKKTTQAQSQKINVTPAGNKMVLGRENYMLIIAGIVILIIGFALMSGGKWTNPDQYNPEQVYSTRRITIAPIVVIIGFIVELYAIFHKSKK